MRWLRRLAVLLMVLALLAAHVAFWYLPRARARRPGELAATVAASAGDAVWLAYPHQNLGALDARVGDLDAFVAALARLVGIAPPLLPELGPFTVPPASELAAGTRGDRAWAVARVYPTLAGVARAAGRLAGNPWLSGGEVESGGRLTAVRWDGLRWQIGEPPPSAPAAAAGGEPLLGLVRVARDRERVPAGVYTLARTEDGLELASSGSRPAPEWPAIAGDPAVDVALLVLERDGAGERALVFFGEVLTGGLPRSAVMNRGGKRWKLPGEGLLGLLGELPSSQVAGWDVVGWDGESVRRASRVAELLAGLPPQVSAGAWIDPTRAHQVVQGVRDAIDAVPFLADREVQAWDDAATVLQAMRRCKSASVVVVAEEPAAAALRLAGCS